MINIRSIALQFLIGHPRPMVDTCRRGGGGHGKNWSYCSLSGSRIQWGRGGEVGANMQWKQGGAGETSTTTLILCVYQ